MRKIFSVLQQQTMPTLIGMPHMKNALILAKARMSLHTKYQLYLCHKMGGAFTYYNILRLL